jgi:hypothetical protein
MTSDTAPDDVVGDIKILPVDVLVIVGQFLAGTYCFGTLASLNSTNKIIHPRTSSRIG